MDSSPKDAAEFLVLLRAQIELESRRERNARHKDNFKLPAGVYEIVEDLGKIEAARECLKFFWHQENDDFRKASMHLSKLAWDLRKRLHEFL